MISHIIEKFIFWSRWLLLPLYIGLIGVLGFLAYRFILKFIDFVDSVVNASDHDFVLELLGMLDIVLMGNLILIVIFSGYDNFVSKIEAARNSVDRPAWMGHVDFAGLKIKLIGSLVAISVIELLRDFIGLSAEGHVVVDNRLTWRIFIHLTFVVSGLLFAVMDWIADLRVAKNETSHDAYDADSHGLPAKSRKK